MFLPERVHKPRELMRAIRAGWAEIGKQNQLFDIGSTSSGDRGGDEPFPFAFQFIENGGRAVPAPIVN